MSSQGWAQQGYDGYVEMEFGIPMCCQHWSPRLGERPHKSGGGRYGSSHCYDTRQLYQSG